MTLRPLQMRFENGTLSGTMDCDKQEKRKDLTFYSIYIFYLYFFVKERKNPTQLHL